MAGRDSKQLHVGVEDSLILNDLAAETYFDGIGSSERHDAYLYKSSGGGGAHDVGIDILNTRITEYHNNAARHTERQQTTAGRQL